MKISFFCIFILLFSCKIQNSIKGKWISADDILYDSTKIYIRKNEATITNYPANPDIFLSDAVINKKETIECIIDFQSSRLINKNTNEEFAIIQFYTSKEMELLFFDGTMCTFIKE